MSLLAPDPIDFEETWGLLEGSLLAVLQDLNRGFPNDLWMTLYSGVYKLCTKPMDAQPGKLYFRLKEVLEEYVDGVLQGLLAFEACTAHSSLDLLVRYRDAFENYSTGMLYGSKLFQYLDRHWVAVNHCETGRSPTDGVYCVNEMALVVWKDAAFESLKVKLRTNIIRVITDARDRCLPSLDDNGVVRSLLSTYETLGFEKRDRSHLFQRELEDHLVQDAKQYYTLKGSAMINSLPVAQYLVQVEACLSDEASRCSGYVGAYTARKMLVATQVALIGQHSAQLVAEARKMLEASPEQTSDLRRLYTLISYLDEMEGGNCCVGMGTVQPLSGSGHHARPVIIGGGAPAIVPPSVHQHSSSAANNNSSSNATGNGSGSSSGSSLSHPDNPSMLALQEAVQEHIKKVGLNVVKDLQAQNSKAASEGEEPAAAAAIKAAAADAAAAAAAAAGVSGSGSAGVAVQGISSDEVVLSMLQVYEHYKGLVAEAFKGSPVFIAVLDDACRAFVNAMPSASEWLARYAHCLLDKGFKESKIDEQTRGEALDRVGFLFAYIADKDIFHKYYAKLLSKRIIQLTSASNDAEERMLANMRRTSGFEYTSKLQRMFVDKSLSRDLHTGYVEWQEARTQKLQAAYMLAGGFNSYGPSSYTPITAPTTTSTSTTAAGAAAAAGGAHNSVFTFTDDEEKASRMLEEMRVSNGSATAAAGGALGATPSGGSGGTAAAAAGGGMAGTPMNEGGMSPPQSPMYSSPKGLSPRTNILPSFAWGKTLFKQLRRHPNGSMHRHALNGSLKPGMGMDGKGPSDDCYSSNGLLLAHGSSSVGGGGSSSSAAACMMMVEEASHLFEAFTFVLTAGCWPLQSVHSTFKPPAPIENYVQSFLEFYHDIHSGRKLEWLYHLGHGEMVVHCFDRPYRVYSSTFQMGVLYQFNAADAIAVSDIAKGIAITESELSRHLYPLIKAGLLLVKSPQGELQSGVNSCDDITATQIIAINYAFTSKRSRVKINIVDHSRQVPKPESIPPMELISDRKTSVQATICRVMKARRELSHKELCEEVKAQLQHLFVPEVAFIKKSIEELIDKDYLARVDGKESYTYCA